MIGIQLLFSNARFTASSLLMFYYAGTPAYFLKKDYLKSE